MNLLPPQEIGSQIWRGGNVKRGAPTGILHVHTGPVPNQHLTQRLLKLQALELGGRGHRGALWYEVVLTDGGRRGGAR